MQRIGDHGMFSPNAEQIWRDWETSGIQVHNVKFAKDQ